MTFLFSIQPYQKGSTLLRGRHVDFNVLAFWVQVLVSPLSNLEQVIFLSLSFVQYKNTNI